MSNVWLVVAESSRAKIYQTDLHLSELTEVDDLVHPASRQHERDLTSDLPGKGHSSGAGSHHGIDDRTHAKDEEFSAFAKQINNYLMKALNDNKYDKLGVIAAPTFLGLLRSHMDKKVSEGLVYELGKSLVQCNVKELKTHLPKHL